MTDILVAAGIAIGFVLGLGVLAAIPRVRLWAVLAPLHVINFPAYVVPLPPMAVVSGAYLLLNIQHLSRLIKHYVPAAVVLLIFVDLVALLWSPQVGEGLILTAMVMCVLVAILMLYQVSQSYQGDIVRLTMRAISPIAVIQVLSTIVFRLSPALEERYLRSALFRILVGSETAADIFIRPYNIHEDSKAGGLFFTNGNRASMVMAVFALVYLGLWLRKRSLGMFVLLTLSFVGAIMSGSKTALLLGAVIPLAFLLLPGLLRARRNQGLALLAAVGLATLLAAAFFFSSRLDDLIEGTDDAVGARSKIFSAAAKYFAEHPLMGLGFGGWGERWSADASSYGLRDSLPAHNFFIAEWSNGSIFAAILVLTILLKLIFDYVKHVRTAGTLAESQSYSVQLGAIVWMIAHGMFDNTWFFGVWNTIPVFAALVVQSIARGGGVPMPAKPAMKAAVARP